MEKTITATATKANLNANPAPLALPAMTETMRERLAAAQARHNIDTSGTWAAYPNTEKTPAYVLPPVPLWTMEQAYSTADRAAYYAVRARHEKAPLPLFDNLLSRARADQLRRNLTAIAARGLAAENDRAKARELVDMLTAIARKASTAPEDAASAAEWADEERAAAAHARGYRDDIDTVIAHDSISDMGDIVQAALVHIYEHQQDNPADIFRGATNAAGRAVNAMAAPDMMRSTCTHWEPITQEEAAALLAVYPSTPNPDGEPVPCKIPFDGHNPAAGYWTVEYTKGTKTRKDGTQRRPAGWYRVGHYRTVQSRISFDVWHEKNQDNVPMTTNGGINAIMGQDDMEEIAALVDRAKLSERERAVVALLIDNTARHHAEQAHHDAMEAGWEAVSQASRKNRARAKARAKEAAEQAYTAALWNSAFSRAHIYAKSTKNDMRRRIVAAMEQAQSAPQEPTPAEQAQKERRTWERMQANRRRGGAAPAQMERPNLAGAVATWAAGVTCIPCLRWVQSPAGAAPQLANHSGPRGHLGQPRTPEQAKAAHYLTWRREHLAGYHHCPSPWSRHNAQFSALAFWDAWSDAERDATIKAAAEEAAAKAPQTEDAEAAKLAAIDTKLAAYQAQKQEHEALAAQYPGLYTMTIKPAGWETWPKDIRHRHFRWINGMD